jgi:cysteinyl-tRNA synthetase
MMALNLYNTLTKRKEVFEPLEPPRVRIYNCGPTVYSYAHIGNFASFVMADLLRRYLDYLGYEVTQVMNITDVGHLTQDNIADARGDDKLEKRAREEKKSPWEIARFYEDAFHEDRKLLNLRPAHHYPRATDHIPEMIEMIRELLALGLAYESGGQIYFEISKFPRYGILSGNTTAELEAGHRVEADELKRNPLDFTLWKKDPKHIMQWDSPWGRGFPGWHIECSAMSRKYLGRTLDIHTGGEDNIFPHHECEIAQSSGGEDHIFSRYWVHRRHVLVEGKKMSKSLGNFFTVRDLVGMGYSGLEIRYALLSAHYRANANFSFEGLRAAREALRYLREFRVNMEAIPAGAGIAPHGEGRGVGDLVSAAEEEFRAGLDDDLNISVALAAVRGLVKDVYGLAAAGRLSHAEGAKALAALARWDEVLGVLPAEPPGAALPGRAAVEDAGPGALDVERLISERTAARARKDFREADRIRTLLSENGIVLKDTPDGTLWHRQI